MFFRMTASTLAPAPWITNLRACSMVSLQNQWLSFTAGPSTGMARPRAASAAARPPQQRPQHSSVGTSPDTRVLHDTDSIQQFCKEGVHLDVDGNELPQRISSLQAHPPVGVLQGFGESGLQLGQEGLQGYPNL